MINKVPRFLPLETAFIDDIRIKRLNKDYLNCSGLGVLIGIYFYLLKSPNQICNYNEIDIIADELRTSIAMIIAVIENYNLFFITKDENGKKFFSPALNKSLEPYFEVCEKNKLRSDLAAIKRKEKIQKQKEELKQLELNNNLKVESSELNSPNIIQSNLIQSNLEESSSSIKKFDWENQKDFDCFFEWLLENQTQTIKNERYYKNTILENLKNNEPRTIENWKAFCRLKVEEEKMSFYLRIEKLSGCTLVYKDELIYIERVEIDDSEKNFKIFFDGKVMTLLFSQLEEVEKLIKKDSS